MNFNKIDTCRHHVDGYCNICQEELIDFYWKNINQSLNKDGQKEEQTYTFPVEFIRET